MPREILRAATKKRKEIVTNLIQQHECFEMLEDLCKCDFGNACSDDNI
jgi:hypothetical protein